MADQLPTQPSPPSAEPAPVYPDEPPSPQREMAEAGPTFTETPTEATGGPDVSKGQAPADRSINVPQPSIALPAEGSEAAKRYETRRLESPQPPAEPLPKAE